ncbi:MAG: hypothetical protein DHS20C06_08840 [Hyphobacterium sp.]|nr:MAG: hypothetical protein DHS20C06_08840 [Hyphobacterium sp.]
MYERSEPLHVLTPAPETPGRGIFVFGAPRGGTSMVAGALRILGSNMGARQGNGNNEDLDIQEARGNVGELGDPEHSAFKEAVLRMRPVIEARARLPESWGWKDPHGVLYAKAIEDLLPAPRLICVMRDPQAVAERIRLITGKPSLVTLDETLGLYQRCRAYLADSTAPAALISYEKALVRPELFVEQLIAFCGLSPTQDQIDETIGFCYPERGHASPTNPGWPRDGAL